MKEKPRINISLKELISVASLVSTIALASYQVSTDLQQIRHSIQEATIRFDTKLDKVSNNLDRRVQHHDQLLEAHTKILRGMGRAIQENSNRLDQSVL